jgi:hypothetical protein
MVVVVVLVTVFLIILLVHGNTIPLGLLKLASAIPKRDIPKTNNGRSNILRSGKEAVYYIGFSCKQEISALKN